MGGAESPGGPKEILCVCVCVNAIEFGKVP